LSFNESVSEAQETKFGKSEKGCFIRCLAGQTWRGQAIGRIRIDNLHWYWPFDQLMAELTRRQQQVYDLIRKKQQVDGETPTLREIAEHFGFSSMNAALAHVRALQRKGVIENKPHRARSLRLVSPLQRFRREVVEVPVYGSIPAGFAQDREQEIKGCVALDAQALGTRSNAQLFALQVRGDSMVGKHILDGDYAIFDRARSPRPGDVVAALIDGESTLKTFAIEKGQPVLRAENPNYPKLVPATELVVQGVMRALVRRQS
jgi:repressor LexA